MTVGRCVLLFPPSRSATLPLLTFVQLRRHHEQSFFVFIKKKLFKKPAAHASDYPLIILRDLWVYHEFVHTTGT